VKPQRNEYPLRTAQFFFEKVGGFAKTVSNLVIVNGLEWLISIQTEGIKEVLSTVF